MASVVQFVWFKQIVHYAAVSAITVFIYDYILTLSLEISLMWTSWGGWLGKFVFFYVRTIPAYLPPYTPPLGKYEEHSSCSFSPIPRCRTLTATGIVLEFTVSLSSTAIFYLRMCTLYQKTRWIIVFITVFFFLSAVAQIIVGTTAMTLLLRFTGSIDGYCGLTGTPPPSAASMIAGAYLSMVPCETVILAATIAHSIWAKKLKLLEGASASLPILTRLYRDGILYFGLALALRLCGAIVWLEAPANLKLSPDYGVYALTSIFACRFFLGLRESISQTNAESFPTTNTDTIALSERPRRSPFSLSTQMTAGNPSEETNVNSTHP
ncbi:hypothetical protein PIIN_03661 [Serendipita indica DSM 11827]|uniref:DUF6533 domain-containing protein n=1 Tax=Serendipita indica (strain DSM 11827) TaxID=1109443 RepID=G4TEG9_SERID|nr:hypothetical protein PIIN_03661 [Serendipita indica DSM 11827]